MTDDIVEEKMKVIGMLTRRIFGIGTGSLIEAEEDIYLWKCFIDQIRRDLRGE